MNYLETLIAFVGVILLASLLVTILTQMVISVFNLRGFNLLWGIKTLLTELIPRDTTEMNGDKPKKKVKSQDNFENQVKNLTEKILDYPLIKRSYRIFGILSSRKATVIRVEELIHLLREATKNIEKYNISESFAEKIYDAENLKKDVSNWFDSMSDRLSERFAFHSRLVSIVAAVIVTLVLQLDSIHLMRTVYLQDELRMQLVSSSTQLLDRGKTILDNTQVYNMALDSLYKEIKLNKSEQVPVFPGQSSVEVWLKNNLPAKVNQDSAITRYREILNEKIKKNLGPLAEEVFALRTKLKQFSPTLLTAEYDLKFWNWQWPKILGVIISIALLSLGAPFWFNALKKMVNLRSQIMESEEAERIARKKKKEEE